MLRTTHYEFRVVPMGLKLEPWLGYFGEPIVQHNWSSNDNKTYILKTPSLSAANEFAERYSKEHSLDVLITKVETSVVVAFDVFGDTVDPNTFVRDVQSESI